MAVRDLQKGEAARQSILESVPRANVEVWNVDLADFATVRAFAERANKELDRLDLRECPASSVTPS
jgi:retinol dehydrogenase-12